MMLMEWIDKAVRMPEKSDEDATGCILAWHRLSGVVITNSASFARYGAYYTHWMHTPGAPIGRGQEGARKRD